MSASAYLQAAVPEPFRILGKRLKPFTLGHELLFERFEIGFAVHSRSAHPTFADLVAGVFICSRDYEEALRELSAPGLGWRLRLWGWQCGRFDYREKIALFERYVRAHTQAPDYWVDDGKEEPTGIPFVQMLKVTLMAGLGMSEEQALNTPYSKALWNFCSHLENEGAIRIWTEQDYATAAEARRMMEEAAGKGADHGRV